MATNTNNGPLSALLASIPEADRPRWEQFDEAIIAEAREQLNDAVGDSISDAIEDVVENPRIPGNSGRCGKIGRELVSLACLARGARNRVSRAMTFVLAHHRHHHHALCMAGR